MESRVRQCRFISLAGLICHHAIIPFHSWDLKSTDQSKATQCTAIQFLMAKISAQERHSVDAIESASSFFRSTQTNKSLLENTFSYLEHELYPICNKLKSQNNQMMNLPENNVPRIFPNYSSNPKGSNIGQYCKYQLLRFKRWRTIPDNDRGPKG